ncbi:MAG: hypothetical protein AAF907_06600 [Planctomycetota bacterium]
MSKSSSPSPGTAPSADSSDATSDGLPERPSGYLTLTAAIQVLLLIAIGWFALRGDWPNVALTLLVVGLTLVPALLWRRYGVLIPAEFQFASAAFVFLSLFLGSAADFYYRYWWWDVVLHTSSGFLLGLIGFLFLFLLNETDRIPVGMKPGFICFFAVTFAVTLGVLWEIVEFAVDRIWPEVNMQSNETGVVDTMQDLIVDTLGAVAVALMGYAHSKTGRFAFIADGVASFIKKNPKLFRGRKV